jgi:hypothetical protein
MKSQTRAWIVFALLFVLWHALPGSPFQYFAEMVREAANLLLVQPFLPPAWQVILLYLIFALLLCGLLLLGRSSGLYLAGICALATMVHHLILCIRTNRIYAVSPAIAIGLALALLFLLIKVKSPALWLSDAYILSLSVWLLRDGFLPPLIRAAKLDDGALGQFLRLPEQPYINSLTGLAGLPLVVWAILPLILAILPLVLFTRGRQKG